MAKRTKDNITIGSGIPYVMEWDGTTLPDEETICVDENRMGYIKGGAALEYTVEPYTEKDDLGYVSKNIVTSEDALLKMGLLTWNGNQLKYLVDRCKVEENPTKGTRTVYLGGAGNAQGKSWVVCVKHEDKKDGNLWVTIAGTNTAGLTLTLAADEGTVLEPEFAALPHDNSGTLVRIREEIDKTTT